MSERALIVAVESYDQAADGFTAKKLAGTLAAAERFREWLEEKWHSEGKAGTILFCSEPRKSAPGCYGASGGDLVEALIELEKQGRDQTDVLYVYFSGHGFRLANETIKLADVLVTGDFKDLKRSAASCFKLDELVDGLRASLGHGMHFYFIDACRNEVSNAVASSFMPFDRQGGEEPSVFVLQSTVAGAPALVGGPFAKLLLAGLRGTGKAKVWEPPAKDCMKVRFDSLRQYLRTGLKDVQPITQSTSGDRGESEAVLATIRPVPQMNLKLSLRTAVAPLSGRARITSFGAEVPAEYPISAATLTVPLSPNHYRVMVTVDQGSVVPAGEVEVELYDDRELTFDLMAPVRTAEDFTVGLETVRAPNARVSVPAQAEVRLQHLGSGGDIWLTDSAELSLLEGTYTVSLWSKDRLMRKQDVVLQAADVTEIAPAQWQDNPAFESIARYFPQAESVGGVVVDPDLGVWLAILGGARIIGPRGDYKKIAPLPLADFSGELQGASPLYLLAGLPGAPGEISVGLTAAGGGPPATWIPAQEPIGLTGIREAVFHPPPGQHFVNVKVGGQPTLTLASFTSPNRCTLLVLTFDADSQPRVGQYLLPLGHLTSLLDDQVRQRLKYRNQLRDVHVLALLSRAFAKRRRLEKEFGMDELENLLYAKWLDPIGASLATYECVRRRQLLEALPEVADNMSTYFHELPDTWAIARLAGTYQGPPRGVPLFLDGLRAFHGDSVRPSSSQHLNWLPYPAYQLDFTGPWTAWRGAV